jgi:hypothetical protein
MEYWISMSDKGISETSCYLLLDQRETMAEAQAYIEENYDGAFLWNDHSDDMKIYLYEKDGEMFVLIVQNEATIEKVHM